MELFISPHLKDIMEDKLFMEKARGENSEKKSVILEIIKSVIVAIIISLVALLIMALFIKLLSIDSKYISIINQIIKGVSIFAACLICVKIPVNGWIKGIVIGICYILLAFIVFSLLDGKFKFGLNILNDVALGAITGLISGIVAVAIRK